MFKTATQVALLIFGIFNASLSVAAINDIQGELQNNIYTNSLLGFSIKFPEEWTTTPLSSISTGTTFHFINKDATPLFVIGDDKEKAAIAAEVYPLSSFDESRHETDQQILEQIKFTIIRDTKLQSNSFSAVYSSRLGGLTFAAMNIKLKIGGQEVSETAYTTTRHHYLLFFVTAANSPAAQGIFQSVFNTLLFY